MEGGLNQLMDGARSTSGVPNGDAHSQDVCRRVTQPSNPRMLPLLSVSETFRIYTDLFTTKCDSKKRIEKQNLTNFTRQNKNNYSNSLSMQFVLCIFTTHYTVDYYKHEI